MALHSTVSHLKDLLNNISHDLGKAEGGNKAAAQRVRTQTVRLEKIAKVYRKESIANEKQNKGSRRPAKKSAPSRSSISLKGRHAPAKKAAPSKSKPKPKAKATSARPRALSLKRPTARLPIKRASFR